MPVKPLSLENLHEDDSVMQLNYNNNPINN